MTQMVASSEAERSFLIPDRARWRLAIGFGKLRLAAVSRLARRPRSSGTPSEIRASSAWSWTRPGNDASAAVARRLGFDHRERAETSRAGAAPETFDIFDLRGLGALRAPEDPLVRIEL